MKSNSLRVLLLLSVFICTWLLMGSARTLSPIEVDDSPHAVAQASKGQSRNLLTDGDILTSIRIAETLLKELHQANWNVDRIDARWLRVPDQEFAQVRQLRLPGVPTFLARNLGETYDPIAFYSSLYVRRVESAKTGKGPRVKHEGFLIVGWKSGRVEQVPIQQVRISPKPGSPDVGLMVWPGLDAYDESLPRFGEPVAPVSTPPPSNSIG